MPKVFEIVRPGVAEVREVVENAVPSSEMEGFPRTNGCKGVDEDFKIAVSSNADSLGPEKELEEWSVQENEIVSESPQEADGTNTLSCKFCHVILENRVYLEAHLHNVHGQTLAEDSVLSQLVASDDAPLLQSAYAEEFFADYQVSNSKDHVDSSQTDLLNPVREKAHKCDICTKSFDRRGDLSRHLKIHTGDKTHKCHICRKVFGFRASLRRHLGIHGQHGGDKLYKCYTCSRTFSERHSYNQHVKTQCGIYTCRFCYQRFDKMQSLSQHTSQCHTDLLDKEHILIERLGGGKPFKCEYCGKSYCHKKDRKRHQDAKHPEISLHSTKKKVKNPSCNT